MANDLVLSRRGSPLCLFASAGPAMRSRKKVPASGAPTLLDQRALLRHRACSALFSWNYAQLSAASHGEMTMKRITLFILLAAAAQLATAVSPRPGLWWNPQESGRGYNVELQDNTVVVTSFAYDANGHSAWYISIGTIDFVTGVVNSTLAHATTGQCFGCPYVPAGGVDPGPNIKIVFDSDVSGTFYYPGGSTRIQPEYFAYSETSPGILKGEWALNFNIGFGIVSADWIVFNISGTSASGEYVGGFLDGSSSDLAVGVYNVSSNSFGFLSSSGGYYDFYVLSGDDKRMSGKGWIYKIGDSPTGSGSPAFGARIFSSNEISRGFHLTSKQTVKSTAASASLRASAYAAAVVDDGAPSDEAMRMNQALVAKLTEMQGDLGKGAN